MEAVGRVTYLYNLKGQKLKIMIVNQLVLGPTVWWVYRKEDKWFLLSGEAIQKNREDQGCAEECDFEFSFHFIHTVGNYIVTTSERRNVKVVECDVLFVFLFLFIYLLIF